MADEALFGLLRQTADPAVVRAFETSVEKDPDRALNRINALVYAKAHGLDEEQTIAGFVHAARLGLFDMSWNMMCPSCGGVIETGAGAERAADGTFTFDRNGQPIDSPAALSEATERLLALDEALTKLEGLGLLNRRGERLSVPPLDQALARLRAVWDDFFPAQGAAAAE